MPRPPAQTFQYLLVWQKAHELVMGVYRYSADFPTSETYGLVSQSLRAAVSVSANLAEGFRNSGRPDKVRFIHIAHWIAGGMPVLPGPPCDLKYGENGNPMSLLEEVSRILDAYSQAVLTPDS
jgi:hypothetical protein